MERISVKHEDALHNVECRMLAKIAKNLYANRRDRVVSGARDGTKRSIVFYRLPRSYHCVVLYAAAGRRRHVNKGLAGKRLGTYFQAFFGGKKLGTLPMLGVDPSLLHFY